MGPTPLRRTSFRRPLAVVGITAGLVVMTATNAQPASADIGIPTWAQVALPMAAAVQSGAAMAASGVTSGVQVLASVGGGAVAAGGTSAASVADLVVAEAIWALPAAEVAGTAAAGTAATVTCPVWCAVAAGAAAVGLGSYGLYKFFGDTSPGKPQPNADVTPPPADTWSGAWSKPVSGSQACSAMGTGPYNAGQYCIGGTGVAAYFSVSSAGFGSSPTFSSWVAANRFAFVQCSNSLRYMGNFSGGNSSGTVAATASASCPSPYYPTGGFIADNSGGFGSEAARSAGTIGVSPPAGGPGPDRALVTTRTCITTAGVQSTVTGTGPTYKEAAGVTAVQSRPACPSGSTVKSEQLISHTLNGSAPDKTVLTYTAPSSVANGVEPAPVVLYYALPDGSYQTCEQNPVSPCAGWWDNPTRDTTYQCRQGSTVLAITACELLRDRYTARPVETDRAPCFDGMGLSPLTWPKGLVISPLKCLFIPDPLVIEAQVGLLGGAFDGSAPGVIAGAISDAVGPVAELGDDKGNCLGPLVSIPLPVEGPAQFHPFDACSQLVQMVWHGEGLSGDVGGFDLLGFGIQFGALLGAGRYLSRSLGMDDAIATSQ